MINLLPDDTKKDIRAARANVTLLNYMLILGLGVAFLALICAGVYILLGNMKSDAERLISASESKTSAYSSVEAQASSLRASLSSAKTILDDEVVYTKIITGIAALIPDGVVLDSLMLSPTTFDAPITLQFFAKTTEGALALKDKIQSSPLFSNVSFQALSSTSTGQSSDYPVSATLSLTINKSATQ